MLTNSRAIFIAPTPYFVQLSLPLKFIKSIKNIIFRRVYFQNVANLSGVGAHFLFEIEIQEGKMTKESNYMQIRRNSTISVPLPVYIHNKSSRFFVSNLKWLI